MNLKYFLFINCTDGADGARGADGKNGGVGGTGGTGGDGNCEIANINLPIFGWVIFIVLLIILTFVLFILGCWLIKTGVARNSTSRIIFGIIFAGLIGIIYYFILNNKKNNPIKQPQNKPSQHSKKIQK